MTTHNSQSSLTCLHLFHLSMHLFHPLCVFVRLCKDNLCILIIFCIIRNAFGSLFHILEIARQVFVGVQSRNRLSSGQVQFLGLPEEFSHELIGFSCLCVVLLHSVEHLAGNAGAHCDSLQANLRECSNLSKEYISRNLLALGCVFWCQECLEIELQVGCHTFNLHSESLNIIQRCESGSLLEQCAVVIHKGGLEELGCLLFETSLKEHIKLVHVSLSLAQSAIGLSSEELRRHLLLERIEFCNRCLHFWKRLEDFTCSVHLFLCLGELLQHLGCELVHKHCLAYMQNAPEIGREFVRLLSHCLLSVFGLECLFVFCVSLETLLGQ
mmetsp:Transcript_5924/g.22469  ORF Transcript_5924/g.22469 Transcript_5924/m.22469 type:complete len:326 (-) Transcript_5924:6397-7374(-)